MLELRPNCECCDRDLPAEAADAMICSFECTFCRHCAETVLHGRCPNCGGELVRRPIRPAAKLAKFPASTPARSSPRAARPPPELSGRASRGAGIAALARPGGRPCRRPAKPSGKLLFSLCNPGSFALPKA